MTELRILAGETPLPGRAGRPRRGSVAPVEIERGTVSRVVPDGTVLAIAA